MTHILRKATGVISQRVKVGVVKPRSSYVVKRMTIPARILRKTPNFNKATEAVVYSIGDALLVVAADDPLNSKDDLTNAFGVEMIEGALYNARKLNRDTLKQLIREKVERDDGQL